MTFSSLSSSWRGMSEEESQRTLEALEKHEMYGLACDVVEQRVKEYAEVCQKNLHYTRGITPKHVTSGGIHLRDLASGQHSSEETSQRW